MLQEVSPNPFAALTLIAAPAVLTNACSVLIMSTSTRLARATDRARIMTADLEHAAGDGSTVSPGVMRELAATERRALMLLNALRSFYVALGGFAASAFLSLMGAVLTPLLPFTLARVLEVVALVTGLVAVGGLVSGTLVLVRETKIAVDVLQQRASEARAHLR